MLLRRRQARDGETFSVAHVDRGNGQFYRVDSLGFLSIDGLYRALGETARENKQPQFYDACFTAEYPTRLPDQKALTTSGLCRLSPQADSESG